MNQKYEKILSPYTLSNGVTLANRVVVAPMTTYSGNIDGSVSSEELDYYSSRAQGPAMFITAAATISSLGTSFPRQMKAYGENNVPGLTQLANKIKKREQKQSFSFIMEEAKVSSDT